MRTGIRTGGSSDRSHKSRAIAIKSVNMQRVCMHALEVTQRVHCQDMVMISVDLYSKKIKCSAS